MRDLHAPSRRRHLSVKIFFVSFRQLRLKVWGLTFFLGSKIEPFSALLFVVFRCFATNACNVGGNSRAPLIDIERTSPRGRHLWFCSAGEMALWTVDRQHMHSTAALFMTTLLKGCNFSHFLLQCQVYANLRGGLASFFTLLPKLSCVSYTQFPIR